MKTNVYGRNLIAMYADEYDPMESRTSAEKAVTMLVRRRITSNQFSALVSLVMHIGIDEFKKSKMLTLINTRSIESATQAADHFLDYVYEINDNGDRILCPFLNQHRMLERDLFLTPEIVRINRRKSS